MAGGNGCTHAMTVLSLASIVSDSLLPEYTAAESADVLFFRVFSAVFPNFLQHVEQDSASANAQFPFDLEGFRRVADQVGPPVCGILTRMHDFFVSMPAREFSYKNVFDCIGLVFSPLEEPKGVQSFEMLKRTSDNDLKEFVFALLPPAVSVDAQGQYPQSSASAFLSKFLTSFLVTAKSSLLTPELQTKFWLCGTLRAGFPHRRSMLARFRDFALQVEVPRPVVPDSSDAGAPLSLEEGGVYASVVDFPTSLSTQYKAKALELSQNWTTKNEPPRKDLVPSNDLVALVYSHSISKSKVGEEWVFCHGQFPLVELKRCTGKYEQKAVSASRAEQLGKGSKRADFFQQGSAVFVKLTDPSVLQRQVEELFLCLGRLSFAYQYVGALEGPADAYVFTQYTSKLQHVYDTHVPVRPFIADLDKAMREMVHVYTLRGCKLAVAYSMAMQTNFESLFKELVQPEISSSMYKDIADLKAAVFRAQPVVPAQLAASDPAADGDRKGKGSGGGGGGRKRQTQQIQLQRQFCYEKHFKGKCSRADCKFGHPCPLKIGNNFCGQDHSFCTAHPQEFQRYQTEAAARKQAKAGKAGE